MILRPWWRLGAWPTVDGLSLESSADLLFTTGVLAGCVASSEQVACGQKHGEALLNGSLGLCEQLGFRARAAEIRTELAVCYYRQGFFELARETLRIALKSLRTEQYHLRGSALVRLGIVERHAGRLNDSYKLLMETEEVAKAAGPWVSGRYHQELATTLRDIALTDNNRQAFLEKAIEASNQALEEFEAVGNHRYAAVVENNYGYLLLCLGRYHESEEQLHKAYRLFWTIQDRVKLAQVKDTMAHLYLTTNRLSKSEEVINEAIAVLENGDEDAILAEALITKGLILCKRQRRQLARSVLDRASALAQRCGDAEGAGRALLVIVEDAWEDLRDEELREFQFKLNRYLRSSQQNAIRQRISASLGRITDRLSR